MSELQILPTLTQLDVQTNSEVPVDLFESHPNAAFWIGRVATMGSAVENMQDYYDGLLEFRANVYIHELGFIQAFDVDGTPAENENGTLVLDEFGRETDDDDERSVSFTTIEHTGIGTDDEAARIVGSGRLIVKYGASKELPIERYFPELFKDNPLPDDAAEISRFIARHDGQDTYAQHKIALGVMRAMTHYGIENDIHESYCIVEKPLLRLLNFMGFPITVMGEPKDIPEYNGVLYPVKLEPFKIMESIGKDKTGTIHLREFFGNPDGNIGNGAFYTDTLMGEA